MGVHHAAAEEWNIISRAHTTHSGMICLIKIIIITPFLFLTAACRCEEETWTNGCGGRRGGAVPGYSVRSTHRCRWFAYTEHLNDDVASWSRNDRNDNLIMMIKWCLSTPVNSLCRVTLAVDRENRPTNRSTVRRTLSENFGNSCVITLAGIGILNFAKEVCQNSCTLYFFSDPLSVHSLLGSSENFQNALHRHFRRQISVGRFYSSRPPSSRDRFFPADVIVLNPRLRRSPRSPFGVVVCIFKTDARAWVHRKVTTGPAPGPGSPGPRVDGSLSN